MTEAVTNQTVQQKNPGKNVVMFDLDGCLSNDEWRLKRIPENPTQQADWDHYHEDCDRDEPLEQGAAVLRSHLDAGSVVLFTTTRPHTMGDKTSAWIQKHFKINPSDHFSILMRQHGDTRSSVDLKREFAKFVLGNATADGTSIIAAYDNIPEIVDMYREFGINACVLDKDGVKIWEPKAPLNQAHLEQTLPLGPGVPPQVVKGVPDYFMDAANLYLSRNIVYKDGYKKVGATYAGLFPDGVTLKTPEDFNRFSLFMLMIHKLNRYAFNFNSNHGDSLDDLAVYAMMLKELDNQ